MSLILSMASIMSQSPRSRRAGFIVAALLAVAVAVAGCAPSESSVFREAVRDDIPRSVIILNYHKQPQGLKIQQGTYWVHFTTSKDDLKDIIKTEMFTRSSDRPLKFDHFNPPHWWNPRDLGEDMVIYEREDDPLDPENSNWRKVLYINSDMTEAYCFKFVYW